MIVPLSRSVGRAPGVPVVDRIDPRLFTEIFFSTCMECNFCHDSCCQYGATVETPMMEALLARKDVLEPIVGRPASEWFDGRLRDDAEYPGGQFARGASSISGVCFSTGPAGLLAAQLCPAKSDSRPGAEAAGVQSLSGLVAGRGPGAAAGNRGSRAGVPGRRTNPVPQRPWRSALLFWGRIGRGAGCPRSHGAAAPEPEIAADDLSVCTFLACGFARIRKRERCRPSIVPLSAATSLRYDRASAVSRVRWAAAAWAPSPKISSSGLAM